MHFPVFQALPEVEQDCFLRDNRVKGAQPSDSSFVLEKIPPF